MKNLSNLEPGEKAVIDSFSDKELAATDRFKKIK